MLKIKFGTNNDAINSEIDGISAEGLVEIRNRLTINQQKGKHRMNSLTYYNHPKWNPFQGLGTLTPIFDRLLSDWSAVGNENLNEDRWVRHWTPAVDITESDTEYRVKVELPEVAKDDLSVNVKDGHLRILGERKIEDRKESDKTLLVERSYGKFTRSFQMPENADPDNIDARFQNGVLLITLPKRPAVKPESVEIKVD